MRKQSQESWSLNRWRTRVARAWRLRAASPRTFQIRGHFEASFDFRGNDSPENDFREYAALGTPGRPMGFLASFRLAVDLGCMLPAIMGRLLQKLAIAAPVSWTSAIPLDVLNFGKFGALLGCYSPSDVFEAQKQFNANCGPAAFSAICRSSIVPAMRFFPHFPERDWTTIGDMKKALRASDAEFVDSGNTLPEFGLALLQLRVNDRPLHPVFSLAQTHWVGVFHGCFYDVNWRGWLPIPLWEELVVSQLRFGTKPVIGWSVRNGLTIVEEDYRQAVFWAERITVTTQSVSVSGDRQAVLG